MPELHLNILETEKTLPLWTKKVHDVRDAPFQRKRFVDFKGLKHARNLIENSSSDTIGEFSWNVNSVTVLEGRVAFPRDFLGEIKQPREYRRGSVHIFISRNTRDRLLWELA